MDDNSPIIIGEPPVIQRRRAPIGNFESKPPTDIPLDLPEGTKSLPKKRDQHIFSHRISAIAQYAALGCKAKEIADNLRMSASRVSVILGLPKCKEEVKRIQAQLFTQDPTVMFKQMAPQAALTLRKIMLNKEEKGSTRVTAAATILDRAYGKAQQKVEHEGSLILELFKKLDEDKAKTVKSDISDAEIVEENGVKKWVTENL
jgi:hypothetical protein